MTLQYILPDVVTFETLEYTKGRDRQEFLPTCIAELQNII